MANINTIKITQLQNIGANLNGNTLFPVVSTVGSNVTDKANLATIATFILGEAGNLLPQAFVSTFSQTVVNAAQPNITSVGTLSALELNNIGTFNIPGGNNGDFLQTNGNGTLSWSAAPGSGNGSPGGANSQIQFNNNGLFGGDTGLTYNQGTDTLTTVNILASNINVATKLTTVNLSSTGNLIAANITTNNFTTNNFTTTGNLTANYFIGDGSQLTGITANASAGGSNGDVQFNSNGAVSGNNSFTYDEANSVLGVNNVLATNIQVTSVATLTDVNFTGNIQSGNLVSANYLAGDGSNITNIGNVNYANSANTANTAGVANSVAVANVVGIGNIATVALSGNGNQFLRGNGTWGNAGGGIQSQIANGTSNVNIPTSGGAVEVTAGTQHWAFGTDGTLTAPNDSQIVPAGNNFNIYTNDVSGAVQFFTDVTGNNHNWSFDGYGYTQLPFSQGYTNTAVITSVGAGNIMLQAGAGPTQNFLFGTNGNLTFPDNSGSSWPINQQRFGMGNIGAWLDGQWTIGEFSGNGVSGQVGIRIDPAIEGNTGITIPSQADSVTQRVSIYNMGGGGIELYTGANNWEFGSDGNFILAGGNGVIQSIANSSLDPLIPNVSTMTLTPDANYNSQVLVLDPTAPGHIHLRAYAFSNIDEPAANIFLGGEATSFEITQGANNQAVIHSNGKSWTFGNDGNITSDTLTFTTTYANYRTTEYQTAGVWDVYVEDSASGPNDAYAWIDVTFKDNQINKPQVFIENQAANIGVPYRWTFDQDGNLQVPGDVFANGVASPAPSLYGFSSLQVFDQINVGGITITSADGSNGQVLTTYGNGVTYWSTVSGGGSYGNSNVATFLASYGSNTITTTGNVRVGQLSVTSTDSYNSIQFSDNGTNDNGYIKVDAGNNMVINSVSNFYVKRAGSDRIAVTDTTSDFMAATNVRIQTNKGGFPAFIWNFDNAGNLTLPGNTFAVKYANGTQVPLIGGSNTQIIFNDAGNSNGSANLVFNKTTNNLTVTGNIITTGIANTGIVSVVAGVTNTLLPNTIASFSANVNNYTQLTIQNKNTGADATADFIVTADNGSDTVNYIDLGIINSGYDSNTPTNSLGNIVYAADGYLYAQGNTSNASQSGGNLVIGTSTPGKNVKIFVGGVNSNAIMANISNTGMTVNGNVTTTGTFVGNGAGLTNVTVNAAGNIQGTSSNVSLIAGSYTYTFDNTGIVTLPAGGGNEGAEIDFTKAPNSTLSGNSISVDNYVDKFRIFESGGTNRGAYIDLTQAAAGVGTLLNNRVSAANLALNTSLTFDNLAIQIKTQSLGVWIFLATVSGTATYQYAITYQLGAGSASNAQGTTGTMSATTTPATVGLNSWYMSVAGYQATTIVTDTTNNKMYRVTWMTTTGSSPYGNFVSIERLV